MPRRSLIERRELTAKVERLEKQNAELNARVAELEMARQLDREAYGQVEQTLGDLQSQLSRQGDDLAFYRSIVSPADGVQGLRIQRFEVQPGGGPARVRAQGDADPGDAPRKRRPRASSQVVVHGMQGDRPARYSIGELIGRPRAQLPFSFRYFQTIEQDVTLPEGFQAVRGRGAGALEPSCASRCSSRFPWKVGDGAACSLTSRWTTTAAPW